jgi:uridine phosphorylase
MGKRIAESELIINKDGSIYHLHLLPEHLCDKIITVGDPDRVEKVSQHFDSIEAIINKREFITHIGRVGNQRLMVLSTGIGTDNIDIVLTELDALANIDFESREIKTEFRTLEIVRIGTSGSMQADIPEGSLLVSDYGLGLDTLMAYYHLEMSDFEGGIAQEIQQNMGLPFLPYCVKGSAKLVKQIGFDMIRGNTVTCPGFYGPQGRTLRNELKLPNLIDSLSLYRKNDFRFTNFEMETAGYYGMAKLMGHEILSANAIVANRITKRFATNADQIVDDLIVKVLERM